MESSSTRGRQRYDSLFDLRVEQNDRRLCQEKIEASEACSDDHWLYSAGALGKAFAL